MARLPEKFKSSEHEPVSFDFSIPDGDYLAAVTKSEVKTSKAGNEYLSLGFQILEGAKKNLWVWSNYNIGHPDHDVKRMAWGQLTVLCQAIGIDEFDETEELHDLPLIITVKNKGDNVNITNCKSEKGKTDRKRVVDKSGLASRLGIEQPSNMSKADQEKADAGTKEFNEDKLPF